jgi:hypothetical protein
MAGKPSGLSGTQYWALIALGVLALLLVAFNIVTATGNAGLRAEVNERQRSITEGVQLGRLNSQFVQALATLSAQTGDEDLRALLSEHGINFTVKQDAGVDQGDAAGGAQ